MRELRDLERWAKQALKDYCGNTSAKQILELIREVKHGRDSNK